MVRNAHRHWKSEEKDKVDLKDEFHEVKPEVGDVVIDKMDFDRKSTASLECKMFAVEWFKTDNLTSNNVRPDKRSLADVCKDINKELREIWTLKRQIRINE